MTKDAEIEFTRDVFVKLVTSGIEDMRRGLQLRKDMHESLKRGETPDGYRYQWIKISAQLVINLLHEIAIDFNTKHSGDQVSDFDLLDILATTDAAIQSRTEEDED